MPATSKPKRIDELKEKAAAALAREASFEAERMALKALLMARQITDYARMAEIAGTLWEAREQRVRLALAVGSVTVFEGPVTESMKVKPGCYLVEPPLVGADARRLRLAALQSDVPVAVVCREPLTKLQQWPVVAIGAGLTIRTRIAPPKSQSKPDVSWFTGAIEALGEWAALTIDSDMPVRRRIDAILERLDAVPDHVKLHEFLAETCREAVAAEEAKAAQQEAAAEAKLATAKAKAKP